MITSETITSGTHGLNPPTGQQFSIAYGGAQAEITQVGATLRTYAVDEQHLIDGFGIDEWAPDGRGQVLAPWPNRLTDGRYQYGGYECQAPINEPSRQSAIHGLVRWLDWSPVAHEENSITLSCEIRPQPGYEWQLHLEVGYALDAIGLTVTTYATSTDRRRAPLGVGFHPYLRLGKNIEGLHLTIPVSDFTDPRQIGSSQLDTAFGELVRGDDGRAVAVLQDPARSLQLWVDEAYRYLMIYTADQVSRPERRRASIAIEPMTCPPNAFRTGQDLIELEPSQTWQGSWGLQFT